MMTSSMVSVVRRPEVCFLVKRRRQDASKGGGRREGEDMRTQEGQVRRSSQAWSLIRSRKLAEGGVERRGGMVFLRG